MTEKKIEFTLEDVKEKPQRGYKKGSKYDEILTAFTTSNKPLVKVQIEGQKANYIRTQLQKRIVANKMKIKSSVVNDECYLEKELVVKVKAP